MTHGLRDERSFTFSRINGKSRVRFERVSSTSQANQKENPDAVVGTSFALRSRSTVNPKSPRKGASEMYEPNDPERNLICHLRACDNEILEIITPGRRPDAHGRTLLPATSSRAQGATPSSAPDIADADTALASGKRRAIAQWPRRWITSEVALCLSASTRRCRHTYVF
jgi:hypothetical protein